MSKNFIFMYAKIRFWNEKWLVYKFTFGKINSRQVNVGTKIANINLFGIKFTKGKYIDRSFLKIQTPPKKAYIFLADKGCTPLPRRVHVHLECNFF